MKAYIKKKGDEYLVSFKDNGGRMFVDCDSVENAFNDVVNWVIANKQLETDYVKPNAVRMFWEKLGID